MMKHVRYCCSRFCHCTTFQRSSSVYSSDVKRGQYLEAKAEAKAKARATRPRPKIIMKKYQIMINNKIYCQKN